MFIPTYLSKETNPLSTFPTAVAAYLYVGTERCSQVKFRAVLNEVAGYFLPQVCDSLHICMNLLKLLTLNLI